MDSSDDGRVVLPALFQHADMADLVELIAEMLERLVTHNDRIPLMPESLTRFHSRAPPGISILDYLKRIEKFTKLEKACMLVTLYYLDRICARNPSFTLSSLTCHRFIIASVVVSSKGLCDTFCTNELFAKVGGIPITELNVLEREFLSMIDWRLMCTGDDLQEYYINLVRTHSQGKFVIVGARSEGSTSPDVSDTDMEGPSNPPSPILTVRRQTPRSSDTSYLQPSDEVVRRPTIEQNMAFAALQQQRQREREQEESEQSEEGKR